MTAFYEVMVKKSAERELRVVPKPDLARLVVKIGSLSAEPRPQGAEKMVGQERYRLRQGDWRLLYEVDDKAKRVTVVKVGHRKEIYR